MLSVLATICLILHCNCKNNHLFFFVFVFPFSSIYKAASKFLVLKLLREVTKQRGKATEIAHIWNNLWFWLCNIGKTFPQLRVLRQCFPENSRNIQFSIFQPSTIQCWVCPGNDSKDVSACHLRTENRMIKVLAKNCSETSSVNILLSHTWESLWVRSSWTHLSTLTLRMAEEESVAGLEILKLPLDDAGKEWSHLR